jgi:hypothetical protein
VASRPAKGQSNAPVDPELETSSRDAHKPERGYLRFFQNRSMGGG